VVDPYVLSKLRDIHLPSPVSAWPPGPAYYALAGLGIIFILLLIKRQQHRKYTAPKREALAQLARLEATYQSKPQATPTSAAITLLLKRVALVYHPRIEVASLHGKAWLLFLKQTSRHLNAEIDAAAISLTETPFNPEAEHHLEPLFTMARRWIKQRRKRCLN